MTNIKEIETGVGFTALTSEGSVVAWGDSGTSDLSPEIAELTDITRVRNLGHSAIAFRANGHIVAWGHPQYGAVLPEDIATRNDIIDVQLAGNTVIGLLTNGKIVAWGDEGSLAYQVPENLNNVVSIRASTDSVVVLKADGTVITWGNSQYGGDSSLIKDKLVNVRAIYANAGGFCALKNDNTVVTWGHIIPNTAGETLVPATIQGTLSYEATDN